MWNHLLLTTCLTVCGCLITEKALTLGFSGTTYGPGDTPLSSKPHGYTCSDTPQKPEGVSEDIVIHYGLNDSHSKSWVQENREGVVGISYFQRFEGNYTDGTLFYKTIQLDGSMSTDSVTSGTRLEKSVLLYDSLSAPHIFVARSDDYDQVIDHYYKNEQGQWQFETILQFFGDGGKFIYELSATTGPHYSFHLLILKTRSNIDSDDFMDAWLGSYLYYVTNASGAWRRQPVRYYNMAYTYDMYIKTSCRQDIKVDDSGFVHVVFSEQIHATNDPSRLLYATNKAGYWQVETALSNNYGPRDDAGWFPSLCLDNEGTPYVACMYINRVLTYSATYCKLLLLRREGKNNWHVDTVAEWDDGYYGSDGRDYTGGLNHLVFDRDNTPHLIFSDIASTHWPVLNQRLNAGNIRYGVFENGVWNFTTIYRQPRPAGFYNATEMFGMCLVVSEMTDSIRVIGEELVVTAPYQYSCRLLEFAWGKSPTEVGDETANPLPDHYQLSQNRPNPFNPGTSISFELPRRCLVSLSIYNVLGQRVKLLVNDEQAAGSHSVYWDGTDSRGNGAPTGVYFYRLQAGSFTETKKMLLLK